MDLILLPHAREAGGGGAGSEAAGQRSGPRASPELDFCETRVARQKQKSPPPPPAQAGTCCSSVMNGEEGSGPPWVLWPPPRAPSGGRRAGKGQWRGWSCCRAAGTSRRIPITGHSGPGHRRRAGASREGGKLRSSQAATACGVPTSRHMKRSSGQRKREQTSEVGVKIWARPTSCPHGKRQPCGLGSPGALAGTSSLRSGPQKKGRVGCGAEGTCHPCDPPRPPHSVQKGWDPHGAAVCARSSVCNSKSGVSRGAK